ncbi:MAG: acyltransferase [Clostridiales bacterium]|nr:acyltransferase [Clostridiales bacterium]MBS5877819.1 acyltransferase [Clostridiales bacterium]
MKKMFNWSIFSKYRNDLFGISIISIIIFHFFYNYVLSGNKDPFLLPISNCVVDWMGSVGVEFFLFLSGMGLFFSMKKGVSLSGFFRKRFDRILSVYIPICLTYWLLYDIILRNKKASTFFLDFFGISFWWKGNRTVWFIAFIIIMYLIFPLVYKVVSKRDGYPWLFLIMTGCYIVFQIIMSIYFPNYWKKTEIAWGRIPIFLTGAILGNRIYNKQNFKVEDFLLFVPGVILKIVYYVNGANLLLKLRFVTWFYSLSLMLAIICVLYLINSKRLSNFLSIVGGISLELYLSHVVIQNILKYFGFRMWNIWEYSFAIGISVVISILLNRAITGKKLCK